MVRITVTDTIGLFDSDTSDAVFEINDPPPHIVTINDVPEDQGGEVAIFWDRSGLDAPEHQMITHYSIWRKYPWGPKIELSGEEWDGSLPTNFAPGIYRRVVGEDGVGEKRTEYWEYMGSVEASLF